jgi:hypothetical protein
LNWRPVSFDLPPNARLMGCPAGLLINFNVPRLVDGVKRLINPHVCGQAAP